MCKGKEIKLKERKKPFLRQAMKTHEEKVWERKKERTHFEIWVWCKQIKKNKKTRKRKESILKTGGQEKSKGNNRRKGRIDFKISNENTRKIERKKRKESERTKIKKV